MNVNGYNAVRECLANADLDGCRVTDPTEFEYGETMWVSILVPPGLDPAYVMDALGAGRLLYTEEPQTADGRDEDAPELNLRVGVGNRLLFEDMN